MGNPLDPGGTAKDDTTVVWFNYANSGTPIRFGGTAPDRVPLARASETGSIWGNAYSKFSDKIFVSAVLRRHSGLGPLGSGGIYMINPNLPLGTAVTNFIDLDALGIATRESGYTTRSFSFPTAWGGCGTGFYPSFSDPAVAPRVTFTGQVGSNTDRGLPNIQAPSNDYAAFSQVGKVSLGDIDISEDGRYLYVANLYDKKIYRIDLTDPANPVAPTLANVATKITS
jgi:DNA-binding beta-propeller fold protein YncE